METEEAKFLQHPSQNMDLDIYTRQLHGMKGMRLRQYYFS